LAFLRLKETSLYSLIPFLTALLLRLLPYAVSGLPYSVDAWPSVRYAELLLDHTPVHLADEGVFGGQLARAQLGDRLFGAVISRLTGLAPIQAMALFMPIVGAISVLVFYALVKEMYNNKVSFIASILLATVFSDVILTAGVKGETYAHTLYMLLILLFLHQGMDKRKKTLFFTVASVALVLTHYYTAILCVGILASMGMAMLIIGERRGFRTDKCNLLLPSILAGSIISYLWFCANWIFDFVSAINWLSAVSYQTIFFALFLYFVLKTKSRSQVRTMFTYSTALAVPLVFAWFVTKRPLVPGAPILPIHYLLYAAPFIAASPLSVLGYKKIAKLNSGKVAPLFWLATVLGIEGYGLFGTPDLGLGWILAYRGLNFILPPLFILCAVGLHHLLERGKSSLKRLVRLLVVVTLIFVILALNITGVYAAVSMQERYLGYFWLNKRSEFAAGTWTASFCNCTVAGDVKIYYLLSCYFDVEVDVFQGLSYLGGDGAEPEVMLTYDQMLKNGYVVYGGYSVDLSENWAEKTFNLNLIYSNGPVKVHASEDRFD
jgi:hypothetical protein